MHYVHLCFTAELLICRTGRLRTDVYFVNCNGIGVDSEPPQTQNRVVKDMRRSLYMLTHDLLGFSDVAPLQCFYNSPVLG